MAEHRRNPTHEIPSKNHLHQALAHGLRHDASRCGDAGRAGRLAKTAILSAGTDDYARVAMLCAFEKKYRLLGAVDHNAQRRAENRGPMTPES
ncbi:hypothetical protein [Primorskyibacter flagellatus]|uniref:Uncharacterized protein n=1 Tax=Primorskyibacter flagellatus TaxID=1387277 RepID=A0A1W2DBP3_9RHOB|nr:hypothetical protein [Primorskyibacter flagellatus]SMC94552.1 hypothetical protein SAMN06295998_11247 [Primorskyibacter flagellatus]